MSDPFLLVIVALVGFIGGGILIGMGISRLRKWKLIEKTPTSKVADIQNGLVELDGVIRPITGKMMTSPVTGTPCISYTVKIQEYDSGGRNRSGKWRTIHKENRGGPFLLQDETGLVKVDPARAKMDQLNTMESTQGLFSDLGPGACNFIESRGIKDKGFFGLMKRNLKVKESVVPVNLHIYALGTAGIIVLEETLEKDPRVSVFTVRNEGKMILSYKSEKETSSHLKNYGFVLIILGSIFLLGGFSLMIVIL